MASWDSKVSIECALVVVGHPGTFRLLFLEYHPFRHTTVLSLLKTPASKGMFFFCILGWACWDAG